MLDELKTEKKVVGIKQLRRALTDQTAELVFLAPAAYLSAPPPQQSCGANIWSLRNIL